MKRLYLAGWYCFLVWVAVLTLCFYIRVEIRIQMMMNRAYGDYWIYKELKALGVRLRDKPIVFE